MIKKRYKINVHWGSVCVDDCHQIQIYLDTEEQREPIDSLNLNLSAVCARHGAGRGRGSPSLPARGSRLSLKSVGLSSQVSWDYILARLLSSLETLSRLLDLFVSPFPSF